MTPGGRAGAREPAVTADDVAVIVVNWNAGAYLPRCLAALAAQTQRPGAVVLVDNASEDGSLEAARGSYRGLRLRRLDANRGFAAANNIGLEMAADKPWAALLNPDAFPAPEWLETLMAAVNAHPEFSFFGCRMVDAADPGVLDGTGDTYHTSGLAWRTNHGAPVSGAHGCGGEIFAPCAAAALYERAALAQVGAFDESFFCYFEDIDLGFRLRLAGHRCGYADDAVVAHVGSGITGRRSAFSVYHGHRNLVWTYLKNMPGLLFWRYLPQHLLINLVALAYFTRHGPAGAIWRAKFDALRGVPAALRQRRRIQRRRLTSPEQLRRHMARGLASLYAQFHA